MKKGILLLTALALVLTFAAQAEAPAAPQAAVAYIMFADGSWTQQYWLDGKEYNVTAANVDVTGEGAYEVALSFPADAHAKGVQFMALGVKNGEALLPRFVYQIDQILVNGADIAFGKGYTSSDDGIESRVNILNTWVGGVPADARGDLDGAGPVIVDAAAFEDVGDIVVRFTAVQPKADAYIMFADAGWAQQYWNDGSETALTPANATVTGEGSYEVSLTFPEGTPALGVAFTALGVKNGEKVFPWFNYVIDEILVNGESIPFTRGFTTSDDGIETRVNIFNEWVAGLPASARAPEGDLEGAAAIIVDKAAFESVQSMTVKFTASQGVAPVIIEESRINPDGYPAFLMFADDGWLWQNMATGTAGDTIVLGDGVYEVFISKDTMPAEQVAAEAVNAQVLNVDITDLGAAMAEIGTVFGSAAEGNAVEVQVAVFVDNERVDVNNERIVFGDIENNKKLRIEIFNTYGTTISNQPLDPTAVTPATELRVVFSLKGTGFNTGADTDIEAFINAK